MIQRGASPALEIRGMVRRALPVDLRALADLDLMSNFNFSFNFA